MKKQFLKINIALADFSQGQQWLYEDAPDVIKMWFENKCILFETQICSLVNEDGKPIKEKKVAKETSERSSEKTTVQKAQDEIDKIFGKDNEETDTKSKEFKPKIEKQKAKKPVKTKPKAGGKKKRGWPKGKKRK